MAAHAWPGGLENAFSLLASPRMYLDLYLPYRAHVQKIRKHYTTKRTKQDHVDGDAEMHEHRAIRFGSVLRWVHARSAARPLA